MRFYFCVNDQLNIVRVRSETPVGVKIFQKERRNFSNRHCGYFVIGTYVFFILTMIINTSTVDKFDDRIRFKTKSLPVVSIVPDALLNGVRTFHGDETKRVNGKA